jgi:hypothetical protein
LLRAPSFSRHHKTRPEAIVSEDDLLSFVTASIRSVWALELLLLLKGNPQQSWTSDRLILELRSSPVVIADALASLTGAGLVIEDVGQTYRYGAASTALDRLVSELEHLYAARPTTVVKAIVASPTDKLRAFSDAFKLKD